MLTVMNGGGADREKNKQRIYCGDNSVSRAYLQFWQYDHRKQTFRCVPSIIVWFISHNLLKDGRTDERTTTVGVGLFWEALPPDKEFTELCLSGRGQ
jgi:hypothetical protein